MISWSLLAFAIPLWGIRKTLAAAHPANYPQYQGLAESVHSSRVKEIAKRLLAAEENGPAYQERIKELISELPDSVGVKNAQAVADFRFRIVSCKSDSFPVYSEGTSVDIGQAVGKFFIAIDLEATQIAIDALPWIATHEICHCLEGDAVEIAAVKAIASLAATILSTFVLGWTLAPSIGVAMLANIAAHAAMSHRAENRADDFANKHSSEEDKQQAILFLEEMKNSRSQKISNYPAKLIIFLLYPSEDARIAKIRATLLDQKKAA